MSVGMPRQIAVALEDMLENCGAIQPGQQVLIVAAVDGLHGGWNMVDQQVVVWTQEAVQLRGAHPCVLWLDMPVRPPVVWSETDTQGKVTPWRLPPVLREALAGADAVITYAVDLSNEEEIKEWPELLRAHNVPMIRNMATTEALLISPWALTPYELVSALRIQTSKLVKPGLTWTLTHPNGTHLEGKVGEPSPGNPYGAPRTVGLYRPFPEGVFPSTVALDTQGTLVFQGIGPLWARHIGLPLRFQKPVRAEIRDGYVRRFEGGEEAETLRRFYGWLSRHLGAPAYQVRGFHGGVHPCALVPPRQCPDPYYREFIEHHHWSSVHVHLGNSHPVKDFPYNVHIGAEMRGASLKVGEQYLWREGYVAARDLAEIKAIAARYPDRPGLDPQRWVEGE